MLARLSSVLGVFAVVAVLLLALIWIFQRRLIYLPSKQRVPSVVGMFPVARDVTLETEDGLKLGAWFIPGTAQSRSPAVLIFNGNAGDRSYRERLAAEFVRAGLAVLLFDYRGYGGNSGSPSEAGLLADALAARRTLESLPEVDSTRIIYLGESLGTGVAAALAEKAPPAALILRSPFPSLVEVGRIHYPFLPVGLMLQDRYPTSRRIRNLKVPILIIAGERDSIIPASLSRAVYESAPEPKRFLLIPGADHNDEDLYAGDAMMREIFRFLDAAILSPAATPPVVR